MYKNTVKLGEIVEIAKGSESGKNEIFAVPLSVIKENNIEMEIVRKCVKNSFVQRYYLHTDDLYLIYTDNDFSKTKYPNAYNYLLQHKEKLMDRRGPKTNEYEWWRLHRPSQKSIHDAKEKLIVPYRAEHNRFAYDDNQCFNDGGDIRALVVKDGCNIDIKYLLAILNSKLLDWFYGFIGKAKGKSREYFNKPLAEIPIPLPASHAERSCEATLSASTENSGVMSSKVETSTENSHTDSELLRNSQKGKHTKETALAVSNPCGNKNSKHTPKQVRGDNSGGRGDTQNSSNSKLVPSNCAANLAALAEQRMAAAGQLSNAKSDADRQMLQQRCDILDAQINAAVYKLYGLTAEEIEIVEKG